jgi:hypothetical protein
MAISHYQPALPLYGLLAHAFAMDTGTCDGRFELWQWDWVVLFD